MRFATFVTCIYLCFFLTSCTYSVQSTVNLAPATDLVDSAQDAKGDVSPNLNLPVVP
jgi:hypothetical protein